MDEKLLEIFLIADSLNKEQDKVYAQIALETMLRTDCTEKLNIQNLGIEMRQVFKIHTKDVDLVVANSMVETEKEFD